MTSATRTTPLGHWEHFQHIADIGVRGIGATPAEAFAQTALAMTAVITDPAIIRPAGCVEVRCEAPDLELLLADWLNAILFEMATRHMLFGRFEVELVGTCLTGQLWGEAIDQARHQPKVEVKAATYTCLAVQPGQDGLWIAQCVVDV
ncbi:MAG: archease [Thermodesulfobacteriota bacterium]